MCTHSDVGSHIEMAELITTDAHVWTVLPGIATQLVSRVSSRFELGAQAITACVTRIHYVANLSKPRWNVPLWRDLAEAALIQLHCHFLTELDFFDFVLETLPVAILRGGVLVSLVPFCCAAWAFGSAGNDCWICSPASSTA